MQKNIKVTKSFIPPISEFTSYVERCFKNEWLTNRGELVLELEDKLSNHLQLDLSKILITNNGTVPLQIAIKLLANRGEVITTPFSYIATTSAIAWEDCTPVFVDINPEYLTIDETKIEAAITNKTTCILATHVFGNPCNIEEIDRIAKKHNLFVIYDAAHCFGVQYQGKSIFEYGDISTCSFHATKLFHTCEGGAIFCKDPALFQRIYYSHNFGHDGPSNFKGVGINAKISEVHAAMGLAVLPYIASIVSGRKRVVDFYNKNISFINRRKINIRENTEWNYSYYFIIFDTEEELLKVLSKLNSSLIEPRRYFYPSLNLVDYVKGRSMPISESISKCILCLPLYFDLKEVEMSKIVQIINET